MSAAAHSGTPSPVTGALREERARSERDMLLRAAFRLVGRAHDEPVSVQQILDTAELSTRAFYRHFRSKDELIITMCRSAADRLVVEMTAVIERSASTADALRALIRDQLAVVYDPKRARQTSVLASPEARAAAGFDQAKEDAAAVRRHLVAGVIARGHDEGVFPYAGNAVEAARAVNGVVMAIIEARIVGYEVPTWEDATDHTADLFLRAFGAV